MNRLRAGDLRHRVTIRRSTQVDNGKGGWTTEWPDLATVCAEVIGLDGRESVMDQALQGISSFRVRIRWRADVRASDQLHGDETAAVFGVDANGNPRDVNIRSVVDPDGKREQLIIVADTASIQ